MSKKRRQHGPAADKQLKVVPEGREREYSAAGEAPGGGTAGGAASGSRLFWIVALVLTVSGFLLLKKTDPGGQNSWAAVSPAFLLCGYLLFIPAIMAMYRNKS